MGRQTPAGAKAATPKKYGSDAPYLFTERRLVPDFSFAVLRREFSSRINSVVDFGYAKLHPILPVHSPSPSSTRIWAPTAHRSEVLLPADAPDLINDARRLLEIFEDNARPDQTDLAVAIKVTAPGSGTLHAFWERARSFAREEFIVRRDLAVVMAMHLPAASGTRDPREAHIHLIVPARELGPHGFGSFCTIARQDAQPDLVRAWQMTTM